MSRHVEHDELTAMAEWLATFPQLESFPYDKENAAAMTNNTSSNDYGSEYLSDESMTR
jgi:hypothetical protein